MTNTWLYFLPLISAFVGWLIARGAVSLFISSLKTRQQKLAAQIGAYVAAGFSLSDLSDKLSGGEAVEKILPVADEHIEHFLRVKLPAAMPMLAMFISDKLVADMKAIFMEELKVLFPTIIQQYLSNAASAIPIDKMIAAKLENIDLQQLQVVARTEWNKVALLGALIGFVTGVLQIFLTLLA